MANRPAIRQTLFWTLLAFVTLVCLTYLTDLVVLKWRFSQKKNATQIVVINPYYAVPRKDHKTEFLSSDPKEETCVNSLFPHSGASPCWYLTRHRDRRIDL